MHEKTILLKQIKQTNEVTKLMIELIIHQILDEKGSGGRSAEWEEGGEASVFVIADVLHIEEVVVRVAHRGNRDGEGRCHYADG